MTQVAPTVLRMARGDRKPNRLSVPGLSKG